MVMRVLFLYIFNNPTLWLRFCDQLKFWCCFIFEFVYMSIYIYIHTASFWRWTPWMGAHKLAGTYLLQGQAHRFLNREYSSKNGKPDILQQNSCTTYGPPGLEQFQFVDWEYPVRSNTSTAVGWTIGGRVHRKPSARKGTCYPSDSYSGLSGLNLRIPLGSGLRPWA